MSPSGHTEFLYYTNCDRVKDQWRDNQGNKNCKLGRIRSSTFNVSDHTDASAKYL